MFGRSCSAVASRFGLPSPVLQHRADCSANCSANHRANHRPNHRPAFGLALRVGLALLLSLPGLAAADWQTGLDAFRAGELDRAETAFRQVVDDRPDWFGGHRMLGQTLLRAGQVERALGSLERAHELAPDDVATRFALAQATYRAEQYERVLGLLDGERPAGLGDDPWQSWLRYRADAARQAGRWDSARADLRQLASSGGADAERLYLLGHLEARAGREEAALEHLAAARREVERGSATSEGNSLAARALGLELEIRHSRASSLEQAERVAACRALLEQASHLVTIDDDPVHWSRAGRIAGCANQADRAIAWLERAVKAGADDWRTRYQLGRQLALADRSAEAEAVLVALLGPAADGTEPVELEPGQVRSTHDFLGYLFERQRRFDEAIEHYRQAGDEAKVAAASSARQIHLANLEAEAEAEENAARLKELERRLRELEAESEAIGNGRR